MNNLKQWQAQMKYVYGVTHYLEIEKIAIAKETKRLIILEQWSSAYEKQRLNKDSKIAFSEKEAIDNKIEQLEDKADSLQRQLNEVRIQIDELRGI